MVYYPGPLHMQKAYRYLGYKEDDFPVTTLSVQRGAFIANASRYGTGTELIILYAIS